MSTAFEVRATALDPELRVLIVDDSAVAREVLTQFLRRDGFTVFTASSAESAMSRITQHRPHVLVLDLQLPGESGLVFLERLMRTAPMPVVVCSGIAQSGTAVAIRALELGAVEVLPKPALGIRALLGSPDIALDSVIRAAAMANINRPLARPSMLQPDATQRPFAAGVTPWFGKVILIGASTGGTEAIRSIVTRMPPDAAPMVIVQHMPAAFTGAFAQRLDASSAVEVREAQDGDVLATGVALVAPGGRHVELVRGGSVVRVRVTDGPTVSGHRPSVDVLFRSAARTLGPRAIGVLLTGMGADGADGMLELRHEGAHTIAQDESTSVVYGMPREAAMRGAVAQILPLHTIADAIVDAGTD